MVTELHILAAFVAGVAKTLAHEGTFFTANEVRDTIRNYVVFNLIAGSAAVTAVMAIVYHYVVAFHLGTFTAPAT